jgi:hypothetical protein
MYDNLKCSMYQLLFLGYIKEKDFNKCPCIECIVKPVCDCSCNIFEEHSDKHYKIVSSKSLSSVEYILLYYIEYNAHLTRQEIDVHRITRKTYPPYEGSPYSRQLTKGEQKRIRRISDKYRSK